RACATAARSACTPSRAPPRPSRPSRDCGGGQGSLEPRSGGGRGGPGAGRSGRKPHCPPGLRPCMDASPTPPAAAKPGPGGLGAMKLVAFDLETTGRDPERDRVMEFCFIELDADLKEL